MGGIDRNSDDRRNLGQDHRNKHRFRKPPHLCSGQSTVRLAEAHQRIVVLEAELRAKDNELERLRSFEERYRKNVKDGATHGKEGGRGTLGREIQKGLARPLLYITLTAMIHSRPPSRKRMTMAQSLLRLPAVIERTGSSAARSTN